MIGDGESATDTIVNQSVLTLAKLSSIAIETTKSLKRLCLEGADWYRLTVTLTGCAPVQSTADVNCCRLAPLAPAPEGQPETAAYRRHAG